MDKLRKKRKVENGFTSDQRGGWEAFEACNLQIARWCLIVSTFTWAK